MSKVYSSKQIAVFLSLVVIIFGLASFLKTTGYLSSLIQANLFGLPQTEWPFFTEASHKGRKGANNRHKTGNNNSFSAVFFIKSRGFFQIFLSKKATFFMRKYFWS